MPRFSIHSSRFIIPATGGVTGGGTERCRLAHAPPWLSPYILAIRLMKKPW